MSGSQSSSLSCKSLFSSGKSSKANTKETITADQKSQIQHTLHIECNLSKVKEEIVKEQDEQRIKELKEWLPKLQEDNWKYKPIDELLGLTS